MSESLDLLTVVVGLGCFLVGVGCTLLFTARDRGGRRRATALEEELATAKEELTRHRGRVERHFERSAEIFGELTRQHASLYAHLAESARELCPERQPGLPSELRGLLDRPREDRSEEAEESLPASTAPEPSAAVSTGGEMPAGEPPDDPQGEAEDFPDEAEQRSPDGESEPATAEAAPAEAEPRPAGDESEPEAGEGRLSAA